MSEFENREIEIETEVKMYPQKLGQQYRIMSFDKDMVRLYLGEGRPPYLQLTANQLARLHDIARKMAQGATIIVLGAAGLED